MIPLIENSKSYPDHIAIIDNSGTFTYADLKQQSLQIAKYIAGLQLETLPVLYLFPSGFNYVAVQWGIWLSGKMAVPVHIAHTRHEMEYLLEDTGARLFIYDKELEHMVSSFKARGNVSFQTIEDCLQTEDYPGINALPDITMADRALMIYTSGTTGKPKGVVISHGQLDTQIRSLSIAWQWSGQDRILNVLPMHHVHGVVNITCCALYNGALLEMQPRFEAEHVAARMTSKELTLFMAVPTIYHKLIQYFETLDVATRSAWKQGMQAMRLMVCGSAALPVPVLEQWALISGHTLLERYGMTEIGMALSNPLHGVRKAGTVGMPLPFVAVKIVDDNGREIGDAQLPGELYVKGEIVFREYWNKPEETLKAFDDGWFKTGDIVEKENDGYYKILGRRSGDIIKSGGYKISALEIEHVLLAHQNINECAVIALPDEVWGETIAVAIVGTVLQGDLQHWLRDKLAPYKTPRHFLFVEQLPRNAMGKVLKKEIGKWFV